MDVQLRWIDLQDDQLLADHVKEHHPDFDGWARHAAHISAGGTEAKHAYNQVRRDHFLVHYKAQDHTH